MRTILHFDPERRARADRINTRSRITDIGNFKAVVRILDGHREVTAHVGLRSRHHAVRFVLLHNVSHHHRTIFGIEDVAGDALLLCNGCGTAQREDNRRCIFDMIHDALDN